MEQRPTSGRFQSYFDQDDPEELALLAEIEALEKAKQLKAAASSSSAPSPSEADSAAASSFPTESAPVVTRVSMPAEPPQPAVSVSDSTPSSAVAASPSAPAAPADAATPIDMSADAAADSAEDAKPGAGQRGNNGKDGKNDDNDRRMLKGVMRHLDVGGSETAKTNRDRRLETMTDEQRRAYEEQQQTRNEWRLKREMREKEELEKLKRGKPKRPTDLSPRSSDPSPDNSAPAATVVRDGAVPSKSAAELRADSKKLFAMWNQDAQSAVRAGRAEEDRAENGPVDADYERRGLARERSREPRGGGIVRLPEKTRLNGASVADVCRTCGGTGHFARDCPTSQAIQDPGLLTQVPSMRDLSTAVFAPHNKFAVGETVLVPSTRGGFTYARITGLLVEEHCFFDPSVEHKTQTWRVCYLANRNTLYKDLPTPYVGKLQRGQPLSPTERDAELRALESDDGDRVVGRKPTLKDLQMVVISPHCSFEIDEIVLVPRSSGGYTYGRIAREAVQVCKSAFEPAVAHQLRAWRVVIGQDPSGAVMRKDIIAACIGKVSLLARPLPAATAGPAAAAKSALKIAAYKQHAPSPLALKRESELDPEDLEFTEERRRLSERLRAPASDGGGSDSVCYKCGEPGHFARECTERGERRPRRGKAAVRGQPDRRPRGSEPREPRSKRTSDALQGLVLEADIAPPPAGGEVVYESQMLHDDDGGEDGRVVGNAPSNVQLRPPQPVEQPSPVRSYAAAAAGATRTTPSPLSLPPAHKSPGPSPVISPQSSFGAGGVATRPSPIGEGAPRHHQAAQQAPIYPEFQQFPDSSGVGGVGMGVGFDARAGLGFDFGALRQPLFDPHQFATMSSSALSALQPLPPAPAATGFPAPAARTAVSFDDDAEAPYTRNGYQNGLGFHLPDLTGSQWFEDIREEFIDPEPLAELAAAATASWQHHPPQGGGGGGGFSGGLEGGTDEDSKNDETFDVPNPEAGSLSDLADLARMTITHDRNMPAAVLERPPQWYFGS